MQQLRRESLSRSAVLALGSPQQQMKQERLNNILQEQIETEQQFVNIYKLEVQAKSEELAEKDRRLQALLSHQRDMEAVREEFKRERLERKLLEDNYLSLKKEKSLLEVELQQALLRYEKESAMRDGVVASATQKEIEMREMVKRLQEELAQVRKHSHGAVGLMPPLAAQPQQLSSAASYKSLVSAGLNSVVDELESLDREQLIQRCQREIALKQAVITKLEEIGKTKGIETLKIGRSASSKKTKKDEAKHVRMMCDMELQNEKRIHREATAKLQADLSYMQSVLYEEQQARERMESELMELRAFAEAARHRRMDSDADSISALSNANGAGGGFTFPDSHRQPTSHSQPQQQQQQLIISQALQAGSHPGENPQRSLRMDSYAYIRLPTSASKRKTQQWSRVSMHLTGAWLVFYKTLQNGQTSNAPTMRIAAELIHHARRATSADIRSVEEKRVPLIFQILYDTEPIVPSALNNNNGGDTSHSRRGSMIDLNVSSSGGPSQASSAPPVVDKSLWRRHELVEVRFHTPTACDLCRLGVSHIFRPPPAVECMRCRMKFHMQHRDKGELPQCKYSFDTTTARDLLVMCESPEICVAWVQMLRKLIKAVKSASHPQHDFNSNEQFELQQLEQTNLQ